LITIVFQFISIINRFYYVINEVNISNICRILIILLFTIHVVVLFISKNQHFIFSNSLPRVTHEHIKNFCDLFPFLIFLSPFLIRMLRGGLLFIILRCIVGYCVLFQFQKPAINNTLTSKECSCDFIH